MLQLHHFMVPFSDLRLNLNPGGERRWSEIERRRSEIRDIWDRVSGGSKRLSRCEMIRFLFYC